MQSIVINAVSGPVLGVEPLRQVKRQAIIRGMFEK